MKTYEEQIKRWTEHFETILNCPEPTLLHDFDSDKDSTTHSLDINMEPFTEDEVRSAIKRLKNGKAAGIDKVQPELLKCAESVVPRMTELCNMIWENNEIPSDWQCGIILFRYPRKAICRTVEIGEELHCSRYQEKYFAV